MSDYIKREDVLQAIAALLNVVEQIDSADVVEVRHGRWETIYKHSEIATLVKCSECGHERYIQTGEEVNYCPNCGARMDGEEQENE